MRTRSRSAAVVGLAAVLLAGLVASPSTAVALQTYSETTGGVTNTWTNYTNAGGTAGDRIPGQTTVQIACKVTGFAVANGNTWWYRIASAPWNGGYYASADAFYNNGSTSGSLIGTPYVDSNVPDCDTAPAGVSETTGGVTNTWTNYTNAGGTAGDRIPGQTTVQIACKVTGFAVANGNTWWYRIASAPWNGGYYASADAFYNNGSTSGSLIGTPYVDTNVPDCEGAAPGGVGSPTITLAKGPTAPYGYRYAVTLRGFAAGTRVGIDCYDSASTASFYSFTLTTDASGSASTQSQCYSGAGPDHWVSNGRIESNHVTWGGTGAVTSPAGGTTNDGTGTGGTGPVIGTGGTGSGTGVVANPNFNRSAAVTWALAHAQDAQRNGTLCTWFVSQALWAGGLAKTSEWQPGTTSSTWAPDFVNYFGRRYSVTLEDLTGKLTTNAVPNAQTGDVILYDWDGHGSLDHMALVVDVTGDHYPVVSEWGTARFHPVWSQIFGARSAYKSRGWTWSANDDTWLQVRYPDAHAFLLHIPGGR